MAEIDKIGFLTELDRFYRSTTFSKLTDQATGLYRESAAYVYELYKAECMNGKFTQIDD